MSWAWMFARALDLSGGIVALIAARRLTKVRHIGMFPAVLSTALMLIVVETFVSTWVAADAALRSDGTVHLIGRIADGIGLWLIGFYLLWDHHE